MPVEQEPLKIEIPVEEEEIIMRPERRDTRDVVGRLGDSAQRVAQRTTRRAQDVLKSEARQHVQTRLEAGAEHGLRSSQGALVRGLRWLSARLANLADRFTPLEKGPES